MKILHITTHMGGGAGKAVAGLMQQCVRQEDVEHRLLILEAPEKMSHINSLPQKGLEIIIGGEADLEMLVAWADIVVLSWWDHPLTSKLLIDISKLKCRMALWTHINGCSYPYLPFEFASLPEMLFVTTRYTLENLLWSTDERGIIAQKARLINGVGDFRPRDIIPKADYDLSDKFVVGYVGTLNYAKMHKDYLSFCKAAIDRIPNVHFLIVGDRGEELQDEIRELGLSDYFSFTGYVEDIYEQYHRMDVLGYLLNADNYGTTENVILEAMAAGLPVVTCKNGPESYILQNDLTGYLVESPEEYGDCLSRLYDSVGLRQRLGKSARDFVIKNYSIEITAGSFLDSVHDMMRFPKVQHDFEKVMGATVFEWFKTFTGPDKPFFDELTQKSREEIRDFLRNCPPIYKEKTKSSFKHFLNYYECEELQILLREMD